MAELAVEHLSLRFGGLAVLTDVSLHVEAGELLALIGPNGAGKTSVLNCISGIYRGSGAIRLRGEDINGRPAARDRAARHRAHLPARRSVSADDGAGKSADRPPCAASQRTCWPRCCSCRACGARSCAIAKRPRRCWSFVGLAAHRHAPVGALPFGVQKLVGFARALALEPKLLLLDEPSAGLNRAEREDLARFILRIKDELGLAMIWIEHDMQMVADLADRLHVLDYGRTLGVGSAADVLNNPAVIAAYIGTRPVA